MKALQFKEELSCIKNNGIQVFTTKALNSLPYYFYEVAASSTGKYHPQYALGKGGLVRHTKAAVRIALELFNNHSIQNFTEEEKDLIISSLILHDGCKHGLNGSRYTIVTHPLEVVNYIKKDIDTDDLTKDQFDIICNAIASHMGEWNKDYKTKKEVLPLPKTKIERFVHMCDYLASRKCIEINFNIFNGR